MAEIVQGVRLIVHADGTVEVRRLADELRRVIEDGTGRLPVNEKLKDDLGRFRYEITDKKRENDG